MIASGTQNGFVGKENCFENCFVRGRKTARRGDSGGMARRFSVGSGQCGRYGPATGAQRNWSRADAEQSFAFRVGRPNRGAPRQHPAVDRAGRRRLGRSKRRADGGPDRPANRRAGQAGCGARGAGAEIDRLFATEEFWWRSQRVLTSSLRFLTRRFTPAGYFLACRPQPGGVFFCPFRTGRLLTGEAFNPALFFSTVGTTSDPN